MSAVLSHAMKPLITAWQRLCGARKCQLKRTTERAAKGAADRPPQRRHSAFLELL